MTLLKAVRDTALTLLKAVTAIDIYGYSLDFTRVGFIDLKCYIHFKSMVGLQLMFCKFCSKMHGYHRYRRCKIDVVNELEIAQDVGCYVVNEPKVGCYVVIELGIF